MASRSQAPKASASPLKIGAVAVGIIALAVIGFLVLAPSGPDEDDRWQRAQAAATSGDWKSAVVDLRSIIQATPDNTAARMLYGTALLELGDGAGAEKEFDRARKQGAEVDGALYARARYTQGEHRAVLSTIKRMGTPSVEMLILAARSQLAMGNTRGASKRFAEALAKDAENYDAALGQAEVFAYQGQTEKALSTIEALLKREPRFEAHLVAGRLHTTLQQWKDAESAFRQAVALRGKNVEARLGLAAALIELADHDAAANMLAPLVTAKMRYPTAGYLTGLNEFRRGNLRKSEHVLTQTINVASQHFPTMVLLGSVHLGLNQDKLAREFLARARAAAPNGGPDVATALAQLSLATNDAEQAVTLLAPLREGSDDVGLLITFARALLRTGDAATANRAISTALDRAPQNADVRTAVGIAKMRAGQLEAGIEQLEAARGLVVPGTAKSNRLAESLIWVHVQQGEFDRALEVVERLEQQLPDHNASLENMRGVIAEARGDVVGARVHYERASEGSVTSLGALNAARLALIHGDLDTAGERFGAILQAQPKHLKALLGTASLAATRGQLDDAIRHLETASSAHPDALQPKLMLAGLYLERRSWPKSEVLLNDVLKAEPAHVYARRLEAKVKLQKGDRIGALQSLKRALDANPNDVPALYEQGLLYEGGGDYANAEASLARAAKLAPGSDRVLLAQGRLALRNGLLPKAREIAGRMLDSEHMRAAGMLLTGDIALSTRRFEEAASTYAAGLNADPTNEQFLLRLVKAERARANPGRAARLLDDWLNVYPNSVDARLARAALNLGAGRTKEAEADYQKVLSVRPTEGRALNNLAWLRRDSDLPSAVDLGRQAVEAAPGNPNYQDTYGWLLMKQGQPRRALAFLERARKGKPDDDTIRFHLASALEQVGKTEDAREIVTGLLKKSTLRDRDAVEALARKLGQ
ncbi:MAG: PEP-CTERM system TPR-repeat protein PrsT [Gammaproteobacteria bacterium]|nr:PEP-CTERM system TPR-repeat protein PrsT [Gammaproteobacteria bacterium]